MGNWVILVIRLFDWGVQEGISPAFPNLFEIGMLWSVINSYPFAKRPWMLPFTLRRW